MVPHKYMMLLLKYYSGVKPPLGPDPAGSPCFRGPSLWQERSDSFIKKKPEVHGPWILYQRPIRVNWLDK